MVNSAKFGVVFATAVGLLTVPESPVRAQQTAPKIVLPPVPTGFAVTPDGTTATRIATTSPSGKTEIAIAPADSGGTSLNRYSRFDVSKAGVDLNNATARAKLIVNEVTGALPSRLEGPLAVLGPTAHVVVANPNGLLVDGATFVGTGAIALVAGRVTVDGATIRLGEPSGIVGVGKEGLSTSGAPLDIVGDAIRIDGTVDTDRAPMVLTAGKSTHRVDPSASFDGARPLLTRLSGSDRTRVLAAIEVSSGAAINGGSIRLIVTDAGPGVRFSGDAMTTGAFTLSSTGEVRLEGAVVSAAGRVAIDAGSVVATAGARRTKIASTTSGIAIDTRTGDIAVSGADMIAVERDRADFAPLGGVSLHAKGDLIVGDPTKSDRTTFSASADGVALISEKSIVAQRFDVDAAGAFLATAVDDLTLASAAVAARSANVLAQGGVSIERSSLAVRDGLRVEAGSLGIETGSTLRSTDAGVTLVSTRSDVVVEASTVSGSGPSSGDPDSTGGVAIRAAGNLVARSPAADAVARISSSAGTLSLAAGGRLDIVSASVSSDGDLAISAGDVVRIETPTDRASEIRRSRNSQLAGLFSSSRIEAEYGSVATGDARADVSAAGAASVVARSLEISGATLRGQSVTVDATQTVDVRSKLVGSAHFATHCTLFFCTADGGSTVSLVEGRLTANDALMVRAGRSVETVAAVFGSGGSMRIEAPSFRAGALMTPIVVSRPAGLGGLFSGRSGWFGWGWNGGFVGSYFGSLELVADHIRFEGVVPSSAVDPVWPTTPEMIAVPAGAGRETLSDIGILRGAAR